MARDQGAGSGLRLGENRREANTPRAQHFGPGGKRALGLLRWQGHISWLDMEWSGPKPSPTQRPHQSTPVDALRQVTPPPGTPTRVLSEPLAPAAGAGARKAPSGGLSGPFWSDPQQWLQAEVAVLARLPVKKKKVSKSVVCELHSPPPFSIKMFGRILK